MNSDSVKASLGFGPMLLAAYPRKPCRALTRIQMSGFQRSLRLQIAQSRSYLHTLGPNVVVVVIYVLGAVGSGFGIWGTSTTFPELS